MGTSTYVYKYIQKHMQPRTLIHGQRHDMLTLTHIYYQCSYTYAYSHTHSHTHMYTYMNTYTYAHFHQ